MMKNLTIQDVPPEWKSQPMYHLPPWGEPLVGWNLNGIVCIQWYLAYNASRLSYPSSAVLCS